MSNLIRKEMETRLATLTLQTKSVTEDYMARRKAIRKTRNAFAEKCLMIKKQIRTAQRANLPDSVSVGCQLRNVIVKTKGKGDVRNEGHISQVLGSMYRNRKNLACAKEALDGGDLSLAASYLGRVHVKKLTKTQEAIAKELAATTVTAE